MQRVFWGLALAVSMVSGSMLAQGRWAAPGDHEVLTLWPKGAPDALLLERPEHDTTTEKDKLVGGRRVTRIGDVSEPTLTVYRAQGKNTGAAVVVFPGGSYRILAIDLEGTEVCDWLSSHGVTCVILKYRVPDTGAYPKSPQALEDAQRAMGMVREHAAEWGVDPKRVGVLGFSAGGNLAAMISNHYGKRLYSRVDGADDLSARPDFAVVVYPAYLAVPDKDAAGGYQFTADVPVTKDTPPTFLVQAEDDPVHVECALLYFLELKKAGVPAELHVYAQGGHGYGLRRTELPVTGWPDLVDRWMKTIGVVR